MREQIKKTVFKNGADLFGVAPVDRFDGAPRGFHPRNVYSRAESVIVFAVKLPAETLFAESPIPFTHMNTLAVQRADAITYAISNELDHEGVKTVLIPTDDPYEYWDSDKQEGRAILSLRHAAVLAGLGKLGRNGLLINKDYGNMIQIGALLTDKKIKPDPLAEYVACPPKCRICLDACPQRALTGETVIQKLCRPISNFRTAKGYIVKRCFECRRKCPRSLGIQNSHNAPHPKSAKN